MIASLKETKIILDTYNLRAKKGLGQNFLIDSNVVNKIVDCAKVDKDTVVIEIGPGIGAMTEVLCQKAHQVICYEIDNNMIDILSKHLKVDNLLVINKDVLKCNIEEDIKNYEGYRIIVVSNLPYYITTPIIFKLIEDERSIDDIFIMVQREVALRLAGKPNTKDYNSLSVIIQYLSNVNYEFTVNRNCFYPVPNVDSAIISMQREKKDYGVNSEPNFLKFIKNIFGMKRKTLVNNICDKYKVSREQVEETLAKLNISKTIRSENLKVDEMASIFNLLNIN